MGFQKRKSKASFHRLQELRFRFLQILPKAAAGIAKKITTVTLKFLWARHFELETQLLISKAVNFRNDDIRNQILRDVDEEQKMLISFMNKLKK
jgi:hypothetical protein